MGDCAHETSKIAAKLRRMPIDESTENEVVDLVDDPALSPHSTLDGAVIVPLEAS